MTLARLAHPDRAARERRVGAASIVEFRAFGFHRLASRGPLQGTSGRSFLSTRRARVLLQAPALLGTSVQSIVRRLLREPQSTPYAESTQ